MLHRPAVDDPARAAVGAVKARFLGWQPHNEPTLEVGDVYTFHGPLDIDYIVVRCPICHGLENVSINAGRWAWNEATLTLTPSVKVTHHTGAICHWNFTNGEFIVHGDSTEKPAKS